MLLHDKSFLRRIFATLVILLASIICVSSADAQENDLTKYVNPVIGTDAHGHTYPGASLPFGMVQLSPDGDVTGWDHCSGYHFTDTSIMGFSHTHLSGTGAMDYGDILFIPTVGKVKLIPGTMENPSVGYRSLFRHETEITTPGYYSVLLDSYGIKAELTATERCGVHRYTFPESDSSNIIIDLQHGIGNISKSWVKIVGNNRVEGMRNSHGWAKDRYVYFVAEFSKPFRRYGAVNGEKPISGIRTATGDSVKAFVVFTTTLRESIVIRVGISFVSLDGALKNLRAEVKDFDFEAIASKAKAAWNKELSKIQIEGGSQEQKKIFYTALYHTMLTPNIFIDVDGKYFGMDHKVHIAKHFTNYSVFSLWDTFRAFDPLMTIIEPARDLDFVKTLIQKYREGGLLPVWELGGNETFTMIGYPSVPVIFDAYMKDIGAFDVRTALKAMVRSADEDWRGLKYYKEMGYDPADRDNETVSKTLEYSYDDWCIAQLAERLGEKQVYEEFNQRSLYYQNVFDSSTDFMRGKLANGSWITPFDPFTVTANYTEANAWQYSFFVPHDMRGLIDLYGGPEKFNAKLDSLFQGNDKLAGRYQPDISGMIGQDAQGDEPSHHVPYLYDYSGEPWKTQAIVREIMTELYSDKPDGLCGNDDCGQMSAWYIFSAMGFYPVTPGQNIYAIGSPIFRRVSIELPHGRKFSIETQDNSDSSDYVSSAKLNGHIYDKPFITHENIIRGGTFQFNMSDQPNKNWGLDTTGMFTMEPDHNIVKMPTAISAGTIFYDSTVVTLESEAPGTKIRYTLDGRQPGSNSSLYKAPLLINRTLTLKAFAYLEDGRRSTTLQVRFTRSEFPPAIYKYPFDSKYNGGGSMALMDGRRGTEDYQGGAWQGFEGIDLDATIDLKRVTTLRKISSEFLQDVSVWIFLPEYVEYYVSSDGIHFQKIARVDNTVDPQKQPLLTKQFSADAGGVQARYLRVVGKNIGVCPPWHSGAGGKAWIFVDEVLLK